MKSTTQFSLFATVELIIQAVCNLMVDCLLSIFLACENFFVSVSWGNTWIDKEGRKIHKGMLLKIEFSVVLKQERFPCVSVDHFWLSF